MRIRKGAVAFGLIALSGVVMACTMKAMPPMVINVSSLSIGIAAVQGYSNPSRAAALKKLDEVAGSIVGKANWKANNFIGPVTYKFGSGAHIVTEDKPCDKNAIDTQASSSSAGASASGGSGGYYWIWGGVYTTHGTCVYGCKAGRVTVGETSEA